VSEEELIGDWHDKAQKNTSPPKVFYTFEEIVDDEDLDEAQI
jgi:hypothetical protein